MKHLFVPYELALKLKEKGFDEPCLRCFDNGILMDFHNFRTIAFTSGEVQNENLSGGLIAAPLYQQVIDWFREKHNIHLAPYPIYRGERIAFYKVDFAVMGETQDTTEIFGLNDAFDTHYEALSKAIEEALKLI